MADLGIVDYGIVGVLLAVIMGLVEVVRRKYRESSDGDRRKPTPMIVKCPNEIEGLNATLIALVNESREQTRLNTEELKLLQHNRDGIDRLVDQHKPTLDGRETWKVSPRMEKLQEESRDSLREIVSLLKRNGR